MSCGIASAFGSPIGGVLFSFEEASNFWTVPSMLRVLCSCCFSDFTKHLLTVIFLESSKSFKD